MIPTTKIEKTNKQEHPLANADWKTQLKNLITQPADLAPYLKLSNKGYRKDKRPLSVCVLFA